MAQTKNAQPRGSLRAVHLVWALLAVMVVAVLASTLARPDPGFSIDRSAGPDLDGPVAASRIEPLGGAISGSGDGGLLHSAPAAASERLVAADGFQRDEVNERGQIERLDAQRNNLADQAALSTLAVTWSTPVAAVTVAQQGWDLESEIDAALAQTVQALQGLASLGVWAALVLLPLVVLPLLLIVVAILLLGRRVRIGGGDGPDSSTPAAAAPSE